MTEPLPYQLDGAWAIHKFGGRALLADEMGLGKTFQALFYCTKKPKARPIIVVCPAHLKYNWENEAKMHVGFLSDVLEGRKPSKHTPFTTHPVIIINYEILWWWVDYLVKLNPEVVVIDECQYIKNTGSRRYKAVKRLVTEADIPHRIALSGTPLTNRPSELWAVLSIIRPDLYPSFIEYADLYCAPRLAPWGMDYSGARHLGHLHRQLLRECMIRRKKKDVLKDLPEKIAKVIPVEITNRQEYEYAEAHFLRWLSEQSLARAKRAKRAVAITKVSYLMRLAARLKVPLVKQWIDDFKENTDEKLVVYSMHRPMIELLERRYHSECVRVDGSVTGRARQARVDQFQKDPNTRFFFGQGRAASTGLTLTAACNTLWTDFPWSPDVLDQADDRVHRIGQKRTVWNHYLVARNTIEDRVCSFLSTKKGILGEVLDGLSPSDNIDIFDALLNSFNSHA
jgi:SWI/SNF-related matrix-associated actin-dependent regulator 1 of chromatin subfamily A